MAPSQTPAIRTSPRKRPSAHGTPKSQIIGQQTVAKRVGGGQHSKRNDELSRQRKAPRCTKCPEHPLRSQCAHTKVGREYLQQRALEQQVATFATSREQLSTTHSNQVNSADCLQRTPSKRTETARTGFGVSPSSTAVLAPNAASSHPIVPEEPTRQPNTPLHAPTLVGAITGGASSPVPGGLFDRGPVQSLPFQHSPYVLNNVFQVNSSPTSQPVVAMPVLQPRPFLSRDVSSYTPDTPTPQRFHPVYDPALMTDSINQLTPQSSPVRSSLPPGSSPLHASSPGSDMEEESSSPVKSLQTNNKRLKPTAANPIYGVVPGAMRGSSQQYSIFRTHELPKAIVESKIASKKFREGVNCVIRKCEALSAQTGCWLFVGAQHAAASGGAIHYTSPRLRRDAVTEAEGMATQFLQLIKQVTESKRIDTLELQRNLDRTKERNNTLESRVDELQSKAREDMEKHQRDAELIREYSQRLGIIPPN